MKNYKWTQKISLAMLAGLVFFLIPLNTVLAASGMDATAKWAWSTNTGWINLAPDNGGVTVYSDHLEGYAWSENLGWIRMGTYATGDAHTYANSAAGNYGVNNDGVGNLSGYAWSANAGWINFAPTNGGVWVDPVSGDFEGYAWGENVGWIKFKGAAANSTAYKTRSVWHGDLLAAYQNSIGALISTHYITPAASNGLNIANVSFINDAGDGILFGHNNTAFAVVTSYLPAGVSQRWARVWQLDVNDAAGTSGGQVALTFDISAAGGTGSFNPDGEYFLLKRASGSSDIFSKVELIGSPSFSGNHNQVTLTVDVSHLGSEFTLGTSNSSLGNTITSSSENLGVSVQADLLPDAGFAPDRVTLLPQQNISYAEMDDLWLEVPNLGIRMNIVGVPQTGDSWDVSWLGNDAGYLEGSAYPTHVGNNVLAGHVWTASNQPGPFIDLNELSFGDEVRIHSFGKVYTYEVRENRLIKPWNVKAVMKHEDLSWVTLLTCEAYNADTGNYASRRMVRAVLVNVE